MIREFRPEDWDQLWPVFGEIVDAGETYAYPPDLTSAQARELWCAGADVVVHETDVDGQRLLLGTARFGPNRPGRGAHIGTASFMVSPAARGRGVGRALGEYVIERLRE